MGEYTKRFKIESDSYLTAVINYIHQNPVKHGFVKEIDDWAFSSYHSVLSNKQTLLDRTEVVDWFGNIENYVDFHEKETAELIKDWE